MAMIPPVRLHRLYRLMENLIDLEIQEHDQQATHREIASALAQIRRQRTEVTIQLQEVLAELLALEVTS